MPRVRSVVARELGMPKLNMRWSEEDNTLLRQMYARGIPIVDIARILGRNRNSIRNHAWELGITNGRALARPEPYVEPAPEPEPEVEKDLDTLLWFIREAWKGGYRIVIPALGATFCSPDKERYENE